jgi:hypothetical protein
MDTDRFDTIAKTLATRYPRRRLLRALLVVASGAIGAVVVRGSPGSSPVPAADAMQSLTHTPRPTKTPKPTKSPKPTKTPKAAETATATPSETPTTKPTDAPTDTPTNAPTETPTTTVDDILARCPTSDEIAAINARLTLSFEQDPTAGTLVCTAAAGSSDLTLLQQRAYQALVVMQALQFDAPLPWTSESLYDWFTGAVTGIRFRGDISLSFCCDPANTLNIQTQTMDALQTDRWLTPDHPAGNEGLVVLLAHEARHNEGFPHTCGTNDQTLDEMGAWAIQYYLFVWLADHSDLGFLTPDPPLPGLPPTYYQDQARIEADATLRTRFCNLTPTAVAVDVNEEILD